MSQAAVMAPDLLSISIVTYLVDMPGFARALQHLRTAVDHLVEHIPGTVTLTLVDNGGEAVELHAALARAGLAKQAVIIAPARNLGYGKAHNLALAQAASRYHLVMNPDVEMARDALLKAVEFMELQRDAVALSPHAVDGAGHKAYLCKNYPALFDLVLRGFAPRALRARFSTRLGAYENRALVARDQPAAVDLISGCFMFCRTQALRQAGGFNPGYFLYFEDFALSLELKKQGKLMYCPACRIVHHGGNAGKKGLRHILHFTASAFRFYNQYGWKLL